LMMEAEQLKAYNQLVAQQVQNQKGEIQRLEQSVRNSEGLEQKLLPIVTDMISSLVTFVSLDKPFLQDERQSKVAELYDSLEDPSESLAITLQRVIDAYQAEIAYGRNLQSWRQSLTTGGSQREVDMLRVGRLTLMYRSLDRKEIGLWQPGTKEWQTLDVNQWNRAFDQASKIARKQAAPDLVTVPVFTVSSVNGKREFSHETSLPGVPDAECFSACRRCPSAGKRAATPLVHEPVAGSGASRCWRGPIGPGGQNQPLCAGERSTGRAA